MIDEYDITDCEYNGKQAYFPNNVLYKSVYSNVNINNLFLHADSFGFSLYELYRESKFIGLAVIRRDFVNHFPVHDRFYNYCVCNLSENKSDIGEFVMIDKNILDRIKSADGKKIQTYILQRALWHEDESLIASHKKIEYETCRMIIQGLGDMAVFKQQYNILEYKADLLFEVRHNTLTCIPTIILEIDENDHSDRNKEYEKERQLVCEHYVNRVVRVPVGRNATLIDIEKISTKFVEKIKNIINELIAQYTEEISPQFFIDRMDKYNIEKKYVEWFYKKGDSGTVYKYDHKSIGDFLGYKAGEDGRYKRIRDIIKSDLDEGEDFIEIICPENIFRANNLNKAGDKRGF